MVRILIIGGGASGTLLACHLLRARPADVSVSIIEKRSEIGFGLAFGTQDPSHLLNVRNANMSAFAGDPDHFIRWLARHRQPSPSIDVNPAGFVSRHVYGRYIAELVAPLLADGRLEHIRARCIDLSVHEAGASALLADGRSVSADIAVLATGHDETPAEMPWLSYPWNSALLNGIADEAPLLILGTGLGMVDCATSLLREGHKGPIYALSRRGLIPQAHRHIEVKAVARADLPSPLTPLAVLRWLRKTAKLQHDRGGNWRSVVDGLRPHIQSIWRSFTPSQRGQFLRHARPWWDIHRHRMSPQVERTIVSAINHAKLIPIAGRLLDVRLERDGQIVRLRRKASSRVEEIAVQRIFNCSGVLLNPLNSTDTLILNLLDKKMLRADPLGVGVDVTSDCAILDGDGKASPRFYAVGPLTRAQFWEITAIPDIRVQTERLAGWILRQAKAPPRISLLA
jgi:uncharacterized NAD(P)/FAD-binding protein YdhS